MFQAYTSLDRAVGRELQVRVGETEYTGMLAGVYALLGAPVLVLTPLAGGGMEQHIPLTGAVVTLRPDR
ncbi:MAG TPA: hypothetical protein VK191_10615 [Symbiobacteriaceae bacterium]|nr:hypothetical protein [Symbiobacteriaceae bacterium]